MLAECKAPEVTINQAVFDQAARYNLTLNVSYFLLSNGLETFTCRIDHLNKRYDFLQEVPYYEELKSLT